MEMKLRRTMLGGFNRRDVVAYISQLTAAREREVGDLRRELERVTTECEAAKRLSGDAASLRAELDATREALENVNREYARVSAEAEASAALAAEKSAKLAEYEQADMQLSEKLAELERVKARVTDIELEAKERARRIEEDARDAAAAARSEADRLIGEMRWRFEEARSAAGQSLNASIREIDALRSTLEHTLDNFGEISEKLSRISAKEQANGDADA